jgi:ribonuclease HI
MPWIPMTLRGQRVLARCDAQGNLSASGGRVEIRYRPNDGKKYQAAARNLEKISGADVLPDEHCTDADTVEKKNAKTTGTRKAAAAAVANARTHADGTIVVYADGACSGNPGPAGLGVVLLDTHEGGSRRRELSEYLGSGTNNIAELTAILRAVEAIGEARARPVRIHTDSGYAIGVLTKGWKAKANQDLVAKVKTALATLKDVELIYVPGHAGVALNERADQLARAAVTAQASSGWVDVIPKSPAGAGEVRRSEPPPNPA